MKVIIFLLSLFSFLIIPFHPTIILFNTSSSVPFSHFCHLVTSFLPSVINCPLTRLTRHTSSRCSYPCLHLFYCIHSPHFLSSFYLLTCALFAHLLTFRVPSSSIFFHSFSSVFSSFNSFHPSPLCSSTFYIPLSSSQAFILLSLPLILFFLPSAPALLLSSLYITSNPVYLCFPIPNTVTLHYLRVSTGHPCGLFMCTRLYTCLLLLSASTCSYSCTGFRH